MLYFNGSQWDAGILQTLIITQAVYQIEDKIQQEILTNAGKKEEEKQNKRFPGCSKIDMGKSVSVSRIGACYLSGETFRKVAELRVKELPVWK